MLRNTLFIIPMYNEEQRIDKKTYRNAFESYKSIDFLLVDDCSTDKTPNILKDFTTNYRNVFSLKNTENKGKGESIRHGINSCNISKYNFIGYMDADLSVPFSEMVYLLQFAKNNPKKTIVMGSRIKLISNNITRSKIRHYLGRVFATIVSQLILKTPVYDTQCGAKIIKSSLALNLFETPFLTRWLFDIELLLRYKHQDSNYASHILETPLNVWNEIGNSKIKLVEFIFFPIQLLKLFLKYG